MTPRGRVLCFCPRGRHFTITLVLSSWLDVERFVIVETDEAAPDLSEFSAAIVMDEFVTEARVARLCAHTSVFVMAWNGLFEIARYRELIGRSADVTYIGTDDKLELDARYIPMIAAEASYAEWHRRFVGKRHIEARGSASYRAQWLRTQMSASRWWRLLVSTAGALRNRRFALRKTVESGFVRDKLVWAGVCQLDVDSVGLPADVRDSVATRVDGIRAIRDEDTRLDAALHLVEDWRGIADRYLGTRRSNETIHVANTLLRWAVLDFLTATNKPSTWFFGSDNMGLGLDLELYVYNLVPERDVAFIDFGGKTSETALYPRSLHLLARQCYVIGFPLPDSAESRRVVLDVAESIRRGLANKRAFFHELEDRRVALYAQLPASASLDEAQRRVWQDFSRHERTETSVRPTVL
jgi:hypothetical protein